MFLVPFEVCYSDASGFPLFLFFLLTKTTSRILQVLWIVTWVLSWQWWFLNSVIVHIPFGNVVNVLLFEVHILSYMDISRIGSPA